MRSPTCEELASALDGRRNDKGWRCRCPAHDDEHPSLDIEPGDNGKPLFLCRAGCSQDAVLAALRDRGLWPKPGDAGRRIVTTYDYRDEGSELLFQAVRYEPKDFRQRRPDGRGGWTYNLRGVPRVLYRLPELVAADSSELVLVVEGEKDADRLRAVGLVATTCPMGSGKWRHVQAEPLHGRRVVVVPDNDEAGHAHARDVARRLHGRAACVKVVSLTDLEDKQDVSDWLDAGGTAERLRELVEAAPEYKPADGPSATADEREPSKASQATLLVELAARAELFHAPDGEAYATVSVACHRETYCVKSRTFRRWLQRRFFEAHSKAPGGQAVADATGVLEGQALFAGPEHAVHVRVAEHDGRIYIDLADAEWRVIEVTPKGWHVVADPPVRFLRPRGLLPLPKPVSGRSVDELRGFVNLDSADDWALLLTWLVTALRPTGPYPVLILNGEQGSAKSTLCRIIKQLIDANKAPLRAEPRDGRDLMIAASNGWIVALDNVSRVSAWLSDAVCRLSTGGGFATRELYTDNDEVLFDVMRPVLINGIAELATRGDLLDRAICLTLPAIHDDRRRTETDLWGDFDEARPRILGALLDAVSVAMRDTPGVKMDPLPRMADFARGAVACERVLGLAPGAFMAAYAGNREAAVEVAVEASAVGPAILGLMHTRSRWQGTARELLAELGTDRHSDKKTRERRDWPRRPNVLGIAVRRLAPSLRGLGIAVGFDREGKSRRRLIVLERSCDSLSAPSAPSAYPPDGAETAIPADNGGQQADEGGQRGRRPSSAEDQPDDPENAGADNADKADGKLPVCSDDGPVIPDGYTAETWAAYLRGVRSDDPELADTLQAEADRVIRDQPSRGGPQGDPLCRG